MTVPTSLAAPLTAADLDYELPPELVAQRPAERRGESRLLTCRAGEETPGEIATFADSFLDQLRPDDLVVLNDARVLHARIHATRPTGGRVELLVLHPAAPEAGAAPQGASRWVAMARPGRKLREGMELAIAGSGGPAVAVARAGDREWLVDLPAPGDEVPAWLREVGELPLPPYVHDEAGEIDPARYQTVYAGAEGSVAAPTAGLHMSDALLARLREQVDVATVTLHVGAGTFLPLDDGPLDELQLHEERYELPPETVEQVLAARAAGRRVVAIGTTTTRVLEHAFAPGGTAAGSTRLFIRPGHRWRVVGALLTNFHLPRSSLLALVASFAGGATTRACYERAIAERMRFYSFGDAMFVHGPPADPVAAAERPGGTAA